VTWSGTRDTLSHTVSSGVRLTHASPLSLLSPRTRDPNSVPVEKEALALSQKGRGHPALSSRVHPRVRDSQDLPPSRVGASGQRGSLSRHHPRVLVLRKPKLCPPQMLVLSTRGGHLGVSLCVTVGKDTSTLLCTLGSAAVQVFSVTVDLCPGNGGDGYFLPSPSSGSV
jgi:hypothetical protein